MTRLALFKLKLLLKQKLGWGAVGAAVLYFPFSLFLAYTSYVRPDKIYWDLTTSFCFMVGTLLASYLGSHLFYEEQQRKTLSFVLTLRTSRDEWIYGQWLGIASFLALSVICWTLLITVAALAVAGVWPPAILWQAQLFLLLELILVLSMSLFFSLFLRPLLCWFLVLSLMALLHSKSYLELLVVESGFRGATKWLYNGVLFLLNFLPPLEWWDIRMFIGFRDPIETSQVLIIFALSLAWSYIVIYFARLKIESMDL